MATEGIITKDQSDILVAIAKLETKVDGMSNDIAGARTEIKEINAGLANRVLNLEGNAVSKLEMISQFDDVDKHFEEVEKDVGTLKIVVEGQTSTSQAWRWALGIAIPILAVACGWLWSSYYTFTTTNDARIQKAINTNLTNYGLIRSQ